MRKRNYNIQQNIEKEIKSPEFQKRAKDAVFEKAEYIIGTSKMGKGFVDHVYRDGKRISKKVKIKNV